MDSAESEGAAGNEFFILKQGNILGPYTREQIGTGLAQGEWMPADLMQIGGVPIWQPLGQLLKDEAGAEQEDFQDEVAVPDWKSLLTWAGARLRHDLAERPHVAGSVCLALGLVCLWFSRWPMLFWLPWMGSALLASLAAVYFRRRRGPGLVLLAALFSVSVLLIFNRSRSLPPAAISSAPELAQAESPKKAPPLVVAPKLLALERATPLVPEPVTAPRLDPPSEPAKANPVPQLIAAQPLPPPLPVLVDSVPDTQVAAPQVVAQLMPAQYVAAQQINAQQRTERPSSWPPSIDRPPLPERGTSMNTLPSSEGAELLQRNRQALVLINDRSASGSGFIVQLEGRSWLVTNNHVAAGLPQPKFTRVDGQVVPPGAAESAVGHDVIRFALASATPGALEVMPDLDAKLRVGDAVVVLGNSGGAGVVTALPGAVIGIGPDRIEVSAPFIPGNSGSPIIHVQSGKVIGIATYLTKRYDDFASPPAGQSPTLQRDAAPTAVVRRFGYRLDSVKQWQPVNWNGFQAEGRRIAQIEALTGDIFNFLAALRNRKEPQIETDALRRPANEWLQKINRPNGSVADREGATRLFLGALRSLVRTDVTAADGQLHYAYFREQLHDHAEVRDRLYKAFDEESKRMSSSSLGR